MRRLRLFAVWALKRKILKQRDTIFLLVMNIRKLAFLAQSGDVHRGSKFSRGIKFPRMFRSRYEKFPTPGKFFPNLAKRECLKLGGSHSRFIRKISQKMMH